MRRLFSFFSEISKTLVLALLIVVPLRLWVAQPFYVRGESMAPTFENGDYLIIDEITYRFREPRRGEVVVFRYPQDPSQFFIKRIIGLPGETVIGDHGDIIIERFGERMKLNEPYIASPTQDSWSGIVARPGEYVVLGDNRPASSDSRRWGTLPRDYIVGKVLVTVWPIKDTSVFSAPVYQ